jgi:hypothetical protein
MSCPVIPFPRLLTSKRICAATVTLLRNGKLDTLALGQTDPGLLLANYAVNLSAVVPNQSGVIIQDVALPGGELVVNGVLDVDDVEASVVAFTMGDDTDTTHVATTGDHADDTSVEFDEVGDLASSKVNLDSVVDLDSGIGVTDPVHTFSMDFPEWYCQRSIQLHIALASQKLAQTVPNG